MNLKCILPFLFSAYFVVPVISQSTNPISDINKKLLTGNTTISAVLTDTAFMFLHSQPAFREVIKNNAKAEAIQLTTDNEPGGKISVTGVVLDKAGIALSNKLVYVYQTSSEGWYSDTAPHILKNEGDRKHARLFGYFKTGAQGKFKFATVKPKGYPNSTLPAHIHIEIALDGNQSFISELLFDDDPRLVNEIRARAVQEKFLIVKNSGTKEEPVYSYIIQIDK